MNPMSTDAFPYTMAYLCELLHTEEAKILNLCNRLGIHPHRNERTGHLFFGIKDVETLQKAFEDEKLGLAPRSAESTALQTGPQLTPARGGYASAQRSVALSRADLSGIVESVSNAKEEILRDLSQLLDDKLSGLDEVVVELIRSKSENDSLRDEIKRLEESREQLRAELDKFKPAAFGFYRKED